MRTARESARSIAPGAYHVAVSDNKLRRIAAPSFMLLKQKASLIAVAALVRLKMRVSQQAQLT